MWDFILKDVIPPIITAVVAYVAGRISMQLRIEVLRWMRVVEKALEGHPNEVLEAAAVALIANTRDYVTDAFLDKVKGIIHAEAESQKPMVAQAKLMTPKR